MNEGKSGLVDARARPQDVRADYEELKLLVDRLSAVVHYQHEECERMLRENRPTRPDIALIWKVGHELVEQCIAELSVVRQRMGLRLDAVIMTMAAAEARRPPMI
jgi:hypothetical protein